MFWFSEFSTLQALRHFPKSMLINVLTIFVEDIDNDELSFSENDKCIRNLKTVQEFINFFISRKTLTIDSFKCELDKKIEVSSHDDGEVSLVFPKTAFYTTVIQDILKYHGYDSELIFDILMKYKSKFIEINKFGDKFNFYNTFDEYLDNQ